VVRAAVVGNTRTFRLIPWIRANVPVGMLAYTLITATCAGLVTGTLRVSGWDHSIESSNKDTKDLQRRTDALEDDRKERDKRSLRQSEDLGTVNARIDAMNQRQTGEDERLQAFANWIMDAGKRRIDNATALGVVDSKISVLDAQMAFLSAFIRDNTGLVPQHGLKR
jgi:hypothetical protein